MDDFDLALPKTEPIYTLPDLPGSRVFYNQAKQILKEAGLKTRKVGIDQFKVSSRESLTLTRK